jgi:hypothetical protein
MKPQSATILVAWLALLIVGTPSFAVAQSSAPNCRNAAFYLRCGLKAAGIPELSATQLPSGEREIRFWVTSGNMMPDRLLILRQSGGRTSGRLFLLWIGTTVNSPQADTLCLERWSNGAGGLCDARTLQDHDWAAIVRRLDSTGLGDLPTAPVAERHCDDHFTPSPVPGRLPVDRICQLMVDGFTYAIEVRGGNDYWRYGFPRDPDQSSPWLRRDEQLLGILACAARTASDRTCDQ